MEKNKIVAIIAGIALVIAIIGLFNFPNGTKAKESTFDNILKADKLSLCYVPWPPSITKDPDTGKLSGILIDIVDEIASDAGLQVSYVESTWGGFPADLNTGRCDVAIAAIYPTIGRSTSVSFTAPFFYAGNSAVVKSGETRFNSIEDLNSPNVRIAVIQGEYGQIYAQKHLPKAKLVVLDKSADLTMPLVAVSSGNADVGLSTSDTVSAYVKIQPGVKDLFQQPYSTTPVAWSVRQGDQELLNFLDNAISYLKATGFVDATAQKYKPEGWYTLKQEYTTLS